MAVSTGEPEEEVLKKMVKLDFLTHVRKLFLPPSRSTLLTWAFR
ncbi:MAG: hypothetical protein ACOC55_06175 [Candidatus Natronoplasma sp.]